MGRVRLSHLSAGFIAVLVGYTSSAAIVFQAAHAAGATPAEISSWLWALGLGMGLTCIGLSLYFKEPILTAWSTPGAALLITGLAGLSMSEAIGIFLFNSLLITLAGFSGLFERLMRYVPKTLAAAMLAGVLLRFGVDVFVVLPKQAWLVGVMLASFLVARRYLPLYAVPLTFFIGLGVTATLGLFEMQHFELMFAQPLWMTPTFSVTSLIGVGIPLFIVSMASQNVPGLAVLRANGYTTPASPLIGFTGLAGLLLAPFGGFSFNLAAITAAMCMSKDADPDPKRRYLAAVCAGCFYVATGVLGATVVSLFAAFPQALIVTIAGLALLGTIGNGLATALSEAKERDAAVITFLVTASGLSLFGLNSAFWGLALGMATAALNHRKSP